MADSTASELPKGRLSSFEDDEPDDGGLGGLLGRRAPTAPPPSSAPGPPTPASPAEQQPPPAAAKTAAKPGPATERHPASPKRIAGTSAPAAAGNGRPVIRSSSVHIPVSLLPDIAAERQRSGRSNGQIVIVAIEDTHSRLPDLLGAGDASGGTLFAPRPSRGVRQTDGPLTALNVRLFEQDYEVIDTLVEKHGALSRGHLITTALNAYFNSTQ